MSQRELGIRAGFGEEGRRTVGRIERREVYPQLLSRQRLAIALGTTIDDLFPRAAEPRGPQG
jgi:transcriptional regulator with XRE-family HTH domain